MPAGRRRLLVVAMVRNEADIIEAFARHHAALVDGMHVMVHAASDATGEILDRLAAEGLAITIERHDDVVFNKGVIFDGLLRRAIARHRPDYVLPLDADEFIAVADRAALESELSALPAGAGLWVPWRNYVPTADDPRDEPDPTRRIRHRRERETTQVHKTFFAAATLDRPGAYLSDGQHHLGLADGTPVPHVAAKAVWLAHYPVRAPGQFVNKIVLGWLSRRLSPDQTGDQSRAWRQWFDRLRPGFRVEREEFPVVARAYLGAAEATLRVDPLASRAGAPRHSRVIDPDPLPHVIALAESIAERGGRVIGALEGSAMSPEKLDALLRERADGHAELLALRRDAVELGRIRARFARARWRLAASVAVIVLLAGALVLTRW